MNLTKLAGANIYLPDAGNQAMATWGYMPFRGDGSPTVDLASTWTNASGFYVFFPAQARSDWSAFTSRLSGQMDTGTNRRFGFFAADGTGLGFLSVAGTGGEQALTIGETFRFRNFALEVEPIRTKVAATYDDRTTTFRIAQLAAGSTNSVRWTAAPAGSHARTLVPPDGLLIPVGGPAPGTLTTALTLDFDGQAAFETGPMYFISPGDGGSITALRYPLLVADDQAIAVTAHVDPALPLDPTRTFFELDDARLATTLSTTLGRALVLAPTDGAHDASAVTSRLVFSDRPVSAPGDGVAYYLTPMGSFTVDLTGTAARGQLICGYSGTETLSVTRGDVLRFEPGHAALLAGGGDGDAGTDSLEDGATTSWLCLTATSDAQTIYYSQPQGSPIHASDGRAGGGTPAVIAHKLAFKRIPAWPAVGVDLGSTPTMPLVPMAPYGAVPTNGHELVESYRQMEVKGINPQRRQVLKAANPHDSFSPLHSALAPSDTSTLTNAMTPLGLIGGFDADDLWKSTLFAISGPSRNRVLQFEGMGDAIRSALHQNQVFLVVDRDEASGDALFTFGTDDATVELAEWFFDLRLQGQDLDHSPVLMLKLFRDKSIRDLVDDLSLWEQADTFCSDPAGRQRQLQQVIADAAAAVEADPNSLYAEFLNRVEDPDFTGLLAINTALDLQKLPAVVRALLGGMTKADGSSNVAAFRAHHVGVTISDTSDGAGVELDASSIFALVDYEAPSAAQGAPGDIQPRASTDHYAFQVVYMRALFDNNALTSFAAEVDLTVDNLFSVDVDLAGSPGTGGDRDTGTGGDGNVVKITGTYSDHDGAQTYSFVAQKTYEFSFATTDNPYLRTITFDKVQFSATESTSTSAATETETETADSTAGNDSPDATAVGATNDVSQITSRFAIWGSVVFCKLDFLDMFSFDKLSFADLGIEMSYALTIRGGGQAPTTTAPSLDFSPGNLRFDLATSTQRDDDDSLLALLPFKLKSFLWSEHGQNISDLDYFGVGLDFADATTDPVFTYALVFDLDLGSLGGLVSSLSAFKFSILLGWQAPPHDGLVFGVQMPEADGKLELTIEGVLKISIGSFILKYNTDGLLVLQLHDSFMEVLGTRLPPGNVVFDLALFAPTRGDDAIGWIAALNAEDPGGSEAVGMAAPTPISDGQRALMPMGEGDDGEDDDGGTVFKLDYLGVGQRVGPDADDTPTSFDDFLAYMRGDFWSAIKAGTYGDVYHPDGGWIVVANVELLEVLGLGLVFYDDTPFYSLKISILGDALKGLSLEITYTKVSDDVGLFFINFTLPDSLRTFEAGAASITLPSLKISIYTNGDFKIDLGFPANDDWSGSFRVEAQAGPIPVTGSGGFYIAKLSSATDKTFTNDYPTILAAGFAARLGVGKDFTAGPLKAGVSLTFFGIIEGAIGYAVRQPEEPIADWLTDPRALSLKGQFGIIGELYGSLDFVIIKASVNVRIQASIGLELTVESGSGGDILLYVEASVSVSVSLTINLFLFKIHIGFSFMASFRFEWRLLDSGGAQAMALAAGRLELTASSHHWDPDFPLQAGLAAQLSTMMTPEYTTVWSNPDTVGAPWLVVSLTMQYVSDPTPTTAPGDFESFEILAGQLAAWALNASLGLGSWNDAVSLADLEGLNQAPDALVGGLDYSILLHGLGAMFTMKVEGAPPADEQVADEDKADRYATVFPMPPFLGLTTTGRATDLDFAFDTRSKVSAQWIATELQTYFEQLYVNISSGGPAAALTIDDVDVPLTETLFLDWFQALTRSTVNALVTQMQDDGTDDATLADVFLAAVRSGQVRNVAGQMSQFLRSGLRLPTTAGMELPDGAPLDTTNPLYALIWQEFAVDFGQTPQYTVALAGSGLHAWVDVDGATWTVREKDVTPYQIAGSEVSLPGSPTAIDPIQHGPQAFALANPITWTPSGGTPTTIRPLPVSMVAALGAGPLPVTVLTRATTRAYDLATTPVPPGDVTWALSVEMTVRQVPDGAGGVLADTFALGAADLSVQNAMRALLTALAGNAGLVASIHLLHQQSSGTAGLVSSEADHLFVLRTNTTTQSVPPPSAMLEAMEEAHATEVGADTSDPFGFLQILEQASVTNQTGYFLTYRDAAGASLPSVLFGTQGVAPVTFLFQLNVDSDASDTSDGVSLEPWVNAVVLDDTVAGQLYYAETTAPQAQTTYVSVAAGTAGVELQRPEPGDTTVLDHLASLYSLVSYQVPGSGGFAASNLSVPSGPQKPTEGDTTTTWRLFAPLYKLATENRGQADEANRYASIGDSFEIETMVVDAFGNVFGAPTTAVTDRNLYFDDLVALAAWPGIRASFNFRSPTTGADHVLCTTLASALTAGAAHQGQFSVHLCPSTEALPTPGSQAALVAAQLYQTLIDQLTAPATTMFVTSNLDSGSVDLDLGTDQAAAVRTMITDVRDYLLADAATLDVSGVTLVMAVAGPTTDLPLVFEIQVEFGLKRTSLVAPAAEGHDAAFRITTTVPPDVVVGDQTTLAADFRTAFPGFAMATGPSDATDVSVASAGIPPAADGGSRAAAATTAGVASASADATTTAASIGLWAVSTRVTDLSVSQSVRRYLAPRPLDTRLRSGRVPMPNDLAALTSLPAERTFSDVDLDDLARSAFTAIDRALAADSAAAAFETAPDEYRRIAWAREDIADRYADHEVDWLLDDPRFTGDDTDRCQGRDQMSQQMRAALGSAYAVSTIVQTTVTFNQPLPDTMGNRLQLFGQVKRVTGAGSTIGDDAAAAPGGDAEAGLGTARVDVPSGAGGQTATTSFLYGIDDQAIEDERYREFPLEWAVSHLQVFLEDREIDYCEHGEAAPPSIWLQFIDSFETPPAIGDTIIPLAYREYPTPPTMVAQAARPDLGDTGTTPSNLHYTDTTLSDQTRWSYTSTYQAHLVAQDEVMLQLVYNTASAPAGGFAADLAANEGPFSLFEALTRFQAGYEVIQGQTSPITDKTPADVLVALATLATQLAGNREWLPAAGLGQDTTGPVATVEHDVVTDRATGTAGERIITLEPDPLASETVWVGDKCITALDPATMKPYAEEQESCSAPGDRTVSHHYLPDPPLGSNFVTHRVRVTGLTTLQYENANSGIGTRRNALLYPGDVFSSPEFIYQTPIVANTNPITPFVDNGTPIEIHPTVVPETGQDLGDYVRRTIGAMMGLASDVDDPAGRGTSDPSLANRRLKVDARYSFPIGSPSGTGTQTGVFLPLTPVVLVRSFNLPVTGLESALRGWVGASGDSAVEGMEPKPYAAVLADWLTTAGIELGDAESPNRPPPGAMFVFDVTLYSQLSTNVHPLPLLRLSNLRLDLSVVAAPAVGAPDDSRP